MTMAATGFGDAAGQARSPIRHLANYKDGNSLIQHDELRCRVVGKGDYEEAITVLIQDGWKTIKAWKIITNRLGVALDRT